MIKIKKINYFQLILIVLILYIAYTTSDINNNSLDIQTNTQNINNITVHFLDIGQADCILIQDPTGANMLIDAGNNQDSSYILKYLHSLNIKKIDYLIATHPHEDHIGSMDDIVESFEIGTILAPDVEYDSTSNKNLTNIIEKKNYEISYAKSGMSYKFANNNFYVLSPFNNKYEDINEYSLVIKLDFKDVSFLFMGDAEGDILNDIISSNVNLEADVLKVGHHGSSVSCPESFISKVKPKIAVITVRENSYNYPHFTTISTLKAFDVKAYQTASKGTIVITSDGEKIQVNRSSFTNEYENSLVK
ncbi:MAG: ComEC/Rec2 family competence protein [Eubacteriaceae bacterium]